MKIINHKELFHRNMGIGCHNGGGEYLLRRVTKFKFYVEKYLEWEFMAIY